MWKSSSHKREGRFSQSDLGGKGYGRELKLLLLLCCNKVAVCVASFSSAHRHTVCTSQDQRHTSSTASEWKWKQKTVFSYFHSSEFQFPSSHNIYICCLSSLRKRLRPGGKQIKISRSKAAKQQRVETDRTSFFSVLPCFMLVCPRVESWKCTWRQERERNEMWIEGNSFWFFDIYQFSSPLTALQIA